MTFTGPAHTWCLSLTSMHSSLVKASPPKPGSMGQGNTIVFTGKGGQIVMNYIKINHNIFLMRNTTAHMYVLNFQKLH